MKWLHLIFLVALAGQMSTNAATPERDATQPRNTPPVLRPTEPGDNVVLTLPGAPTPAPRKPAPGIASPKPVQQQPDAAYGSAPPVAAKPAVSPLPMLTVPKTELTLAPVETATRGESSKSPLAAGSPAVEEKVKPALPPDFARESAMFCQKAIGRWKEADARSLLGKPLRQRAAYAEDKKTVNGRIYAFSDPSGRYKELELDFDKATGKLRTVFGYPPLMTWQKCLRLWGDKVTSADARQGRTFYSYLNRRLDVLVDPKGNVISLGLY